MSWEGIRYYLQFPVAVPDSRVRNLRLTTPSAAVRQSLHPEGINERLLARLACLIHAANVHSEPGSNPSNDCLSRRTSPEGPTAGVEQIQKLDAGCADGQYTRAISRVPKDELAELV